MPTYEYKCDACGHAFEQFQSITAGPIRKCPKCGKLKVRRLISTGAGLIFKGSGFYETDYRSESYKKAAKADAPQTASTDSKPAESKPATTETAAPAKSTPAETPKPKAKTTKEKT